eukprot:2711706-Rhodomonas_salina.4
MESEAALRYACCRLVGSSSRKADPFECAFEKGATNIHKYAMQLHLHSTIQERYSMLPRNNACLDLVSLGNAE